MREISNTIGLIFDFDDTIVPDSTTQLLRHYGMDPQQFWRKEVARLIRSGYDPALASLNLLLYNTRPGKPLESLSAVDLRELGHGMEQTFFVGFRDLVRDVRRIVAKYRVIQAQFYIISGGLQDVMEGSPFLRGQFSGIYGSQLAGDTDSGPLKYIKRCITFTEKTRYLFEISKGLDPRKTQSNPYLVNKEVPSHKRLLQWTNMIYVGDGYTDIPSFSLINQKGGSCFGVFNPDKPTSAKRALMEFLKPNRVISMHAPRYRKADELGSMIRATVETQCNRIRLVREQAGVLE